jgi:Flp pilus assembly protein protease CpaA
MLFFILTLFIILHVLIGVYDFSFYRIPNLFLALLLVLYAFYAPIYLTPHLIFTSLGVFAVMLALSFALYAFNIIGAGDAKYIAVASLWFGLHGLAPLLFTISLVGGVLAIFYLLFRDHMGRLSDWAWGKIQNAETAFPKLQCVWAGSGAGPEKGKRENIESRMIPYGIAIAGGAIIMLMMNPIIH